MEPVIKGVQIAIFYKPVYIGSNIDVASLIRTNFGQENQLNIYPIPQDAPAEIPRMDIQFENFSFKFSNVRADMVINDAEPTDADIENFINVVRGFNSTITRVGYVLKRSYENIRNDVLRSNFSLDEDRFADLNELAEANWRVNRIQDIGGGECNNISTITMESVEDQLNIILERDVNTVKSRANLNLIDSASTTQLLTALKVESGTSFGIIQHG